MLGNIYRSQRRNGNLTGWAVVESYQGNFLWNLISLFCQCAQNSYGDGIVICHKSSWQGSV